MTECHLKLNSKYDAASAWADAALAYRKVDPKEAINAQQRAVELYCEMGKFSTAAKFAKELAELYEGDNDLENACTQYQLAADYFDGENQKTFVKLKIYTCLDLLINVYQSVLTCWPLWASMMMPLLRLKKLPMTV